MPSATELRHIGGHPLLGVQGIRGEMLIPPASSCRRSSSWPATIFVLRSSTKAAIAPPIRTVTASRMPRKAAASGQVKVIRDPPGCGAFGPALVRVWAASASVEAGQVQVEIGDLVELQRPCRPRTAPGCRRAARQPRVVAGAWAGTADPDLAGQVADVVTAAGQRATIRRRIGLARAASVSTRSSPVGGAAIIRFLHAGHLTHETYSTTPA